MNLREVFGKNVSSSAFKLIDGELNIIGKWCRITLEDNGVFDVWICNTKDISAGLGTRAVRNRLLPFQDRTGTKVVELTGEGYARVRRKEIILENLPLLGIKKKRRISDEQRKRIAEQLKKYHAVS